jgi:branched-chain amino acid transport system ATP-binding protein
VGGAAGSADGVRGAAGSAGGVRGAAGSANPVGGTAGSAGGVGGAVALETLGLYKSFGALRVADGIHFRLPTGARHALIGPNGAGKTTLLNLIAGALAPSAGQIRLHGRDITPLPQHARVRLGLARTFQINQLFGGLPVIDNVALAIAERTGASRQLWRPLGRQHALLDEAFALLETLGLAAAALRPIRTLPYGHQRIVEIAIALAARPRVLLLDEPAAGVPAAETRAILDAIERLHEDIAVLIVEHDMDLVFRFARRITVMVGGAILTAGTRQDIAADARVRAAYLGERHRG